MATMEQRETGWTMSRKERASERERERGGGGGEREEEEEEEEDRVILLVFRRCRELTMRRVASSGVLLMYLAASRGLDAC